MPLPWKINSKSDCTCSRSSRTLVIHIIERVESLESQCKPYRLRNVKLQKEQGHLVEVLKYLASIHGFTFLEAYIRGEEKGWYMEALLFLYFGGVIHEGLYSEFYGIHHIWNKRKGWGLCSLSTKLGMTWIKFLTRPNVNLKHLKYVLSKNNTANEKTVLTGDFNINLFNRDVNRGCLVYMFSLRFSGSQFLINLRRQFCVRKIFFAYVKFFVYKFSLDSQSFILGCSFIKTCSLTGSQQGFLF